MFLFIYNHGLLILKAVITWLEDSSDEEKGTCWLHSDPNELSYTELTVLEKLDARFNMNLKRYVLL